MDARVIDINHHNDVRDLGMAAAADLLSGAYHFNTGTT
jgi:hypothetical protein